MNIDVGWIQFQSLLKLPHRTFDIAFIKQFVPADI